MKKQLLGTFYSALSLAMFSCNGLADKQKNLPIANDTRIQWLDSIVDFGEVVYGNKVTIRFRYRNTGNKPLIFSEVQPSCDCTVTDYNKQYVLPGSDGTITAVFDTKKGIIGYVRKSIMVIANTKPANSYYLTYTGIVTGHK